nr:hypothetical protein [Sinimarinibacterium sp. NLF-5-8]
MSRWLKGRSIPEQDKLQVLAQWLSVDPQTLRFGTPSAPDPFLQPGFWPPNFARKADSNAPQKEQATIPMTFARTTRPQLSNDEWKMIEQWQSLPKPTQQTIAALIKALAAATQ